LDEDLAYVLGVFVGDGHKTKSGIGFTCRTEADAKDLGRQIEAIFGVPAKVYWDPPEKAETSSAGGRWRVEVHSRELKRFLTYLGIDLSALARSKAVPKALLRSPREVVSAFLRGYFDADGYAGKGGVILSSSSRELMKTVQLLLLNYGILSTQRKQAKDNWHLEITGQSAARFLSEIGLSRKAKRRALEKYVMDRHWFKQEDESDQVASIEHGCADVFDITVETSQAYVANGFINHNSYWHSKIMTEKALEGSELIDYADHHSGTMGTRPGRINPYKLGVELFRDIEDRWNKGKFGKDYEECDDLKEKKRWDKKVGLGREKIFEVRRIYNDVSFIDTFLTEEFCQEQKLFTYRFNHHTGFYEIADRDYKKVKEKLLFSLTNFGKPFIYVIESNYGNRGELYLKHRHEGVDLKLNYARDTLRNINYLWGRPVHLETAVDGQGKILTYDGKKHYDRDIKADQT
jgi:stage V sporulation protein R